MQTFTRSIGLHSSHTHSNSNQGRISNADHVSSTSSSIVRGSLTILFSQYTLVIISGLETRVIALKKAMVQRLLHFDRPFPDVHAGGLVDKIRTQPTRMYDEECSGRAGVGRTNQSNLDKTTYSVQYTSDFLNRRHHRS